MIRSRLVERTMGVAGIACFISLFVLSTYFMGHRPHEMRPEVGRTYAYQEHGSTVYVTHSEHLLILALPWAALSLVVSAAAIRANSRFPSKISM